MAGPNILNFASKVSFLNGVVFLNGVALTLPNAASDPGSANAGDMYYNTGSNTIRFYNGTIWSDIGGGSSSYLVNEFTLSPTDISNGYVTLSSAPAIAADTVLTVIGGPMQSYGVDFTVSGAQLTFINSLAFGGVSALVSGDMLVIQYN
jgi:hypothetical protein